MAKFSYFWALSKIAEKSSGCSCPRPSNSIAPCHVSLRRLHKSLKKTQYNSSYCELGPPVTKTLEKMRAWPGEQKLSRRFCEYFPLIRPIISTPNIERPRCPQWLCPSYTNTLNCLRKSNYLIDLILLRLLLHAQVQFSHGLHVTSSFSKI